jgi:hypothetical protein
MRFTAERWKRVHLPDLIAMTADPDDLRRQTINAVNVKLSIRGRGQFRDDVRTRVPGIVAIQPHGRPRAIRSRCSTAFTWRSDHHRPEARPLRWR